jgi:hypothetical protein
MPLHSPIMSFLCKTCFDLRDNRDCEWELPSEPVDLEVFKQAAVDCPSGGCNILLEAIAKVARPGEVESNDRLVRPRAIYQSDRRNYGRFEYCEGFEYSEYTKRIRLFVTEGT